MITPSIPMAVAQCFAALDGRLDVWKATLYINEKQTVKATRRRFQGKISKQGRGDYIVTVGQPNYSERQFLKACKRAGEPIPVRRVQLKILPQRRK